VKSPKLNSVNVTEIPNSGKANNKNTHRSSSRPEDASGCDSNRSRGRQPDITRRLIVERRVGESVVVEDDLAQERSPRERSIIDAITPNTGMEQSD
jgi:hypothetical protein